MRVNIFAIAVGIFLGMGPPAIAATAPSYRCGVTLITEASTTPCKRSVNFPDPTAGQSIADFIRTIESKGPFKVNIGIVDPARQETDWSMKSTKVENVKVDGSVIHLNSSPKDSDSGWLVPLENVLFLEFAPFSGDAPSHYEGSLTIFLKTSK